MKIAILTGEPSGDLLASHVVQALRAQSPDMELIGVGGELLAAQGLNSRFPLSEFSINGVIEVLPHIPRLLLRVEQLTRWLLAEQPDVVLTVDAPDLTLRIAKALRRRGFKGKLVHLVAPTVWAWKPERAKKMAGFLDHVLCLFPFEPPFFDRHGLGATFVGHPILERPAPNAIKDPRALLLLPGSRMNEAREMVPLFRDAVSQLSANRSGLHCVVPTVETTRDYVMRAMTTWPTPIEFVFRPADKAQAFAKASVGLAASGTVALELAQADVAGVISYKVRPATYRTIRRQTQLEHFSLINILGRAEIMPEHMQDDAVPAPIAADLNRLLGDEPAWQAQIAQQRAALRSLALPAGQRPATLAAQTILSLL